jgi:hypothetical protein
VKWGIEHLKVTLRDDSGETVVIEQSKDGAIRCEQANGIAAEGRGRARANRREPDEGAGSRQATGRRESGTPKRGAPKHGRRGPRGTSEQSAKKPKARGQAEVAPREAAGSLDWLPTKDSKAWGVLARSGSGQFKVLRSASSDLVAVL